MANFVAEQKPFRADQGHEWEIDAGARFEVAPQLRLGAEFWTIQETVGGVTEVSYFVGPSVSRASSKIRLQLGAGFGIGDSSGATFVRSGLGINL